MNSLMHSCVLGNRPIMAEPSYSVDNFSVHVDDYKCGACGQMFNTICTLHDHIQTYHQMHGGSYHYNHHYKIAFPKYDFTCSSTQTEASRVEDSQRFQDGNIDDMNGLQDICIKGECYENSNGGGYSNTVAEKLDKNSGMGHVSRERDEDFSKIGGWSRDSLKMEMLSEDAIKEFENLARYIDGTDKVGDNDMAIIKAEIEEYGQSYANNKVKKKIRKKRLSKKSSKVRNAENSLEDEMVDVNVDSTDSVTTGKSVLKRKKRLSTPLHNGGISSEGNASNTSDYAVDAAADNGSDPEFIIQSDVETPETDSPKSKSKPNTIYTCVKCDLVFPSRWKYLQHNRKLHRTVKNETTDKKAKQNKTWSCEPCEKVYTTESGLYQHNLAKHSDKVFQCDICSLRLSSPLTLKQHRIEQHFVTITEFQCRECKKQFANSSHYKEHMKNKHNMHNNETFVCETCGFQTNVRAKLRDHHRDNHKKRRVLKCEECAFTSCSSANLKFHIKMHTGERDYICHYCGVAFSCPGTLTRHMRVHTGERPFKCEICTKTFATETPYSRHLDMHSSKKRFSCDFCKKEFVQKNNCVAHMRQHTGEKPYKCDICGLGFTHNVSRRTHMAKQHNTNAPPFTKPEFNYADLVRVIKSD